MRIFSAVTKSAALALAVSACEGPEGAAGPAGPPGEAGAPGEPAAPGEAGADGLCAGREALIINGVEGVDAVVFPGEEVEVAFQVGGDAANISWQFVGTAQSESGAVSLPAAPEAATEANTFTVTPAVEGTSSFIAIATDGCTVATTRFEVRAAYARVGVYHLSSAADGVQVFVDESDSPVEWIAMSFFGPMPTTDIFPEEATSFAAMGKREAAISVYSEDGLAGDLDATFAPGGRYLVVAHDDKFGAFTLSQLELPKFPFASDDSVLLTFAHLADGVGPASLGVGPDLATPLIDGVTYKSQSDELPLPVGNLFAYADVTDDGKADVRVFLGIENAGVLAGETVVAVAHLDGTGEIAVSVHDSFTVEGVDALLGFGFGAPVLAVPPTAAEAGVGLVHLVPDFGAASVYAGELLVRLGMATTVAYGEAAGFAKAALGVNALTIAVEDIATPIPVSTPALVAGDRAIAVAHLDGDGDAAIAFIKPDVSPLDDADGVRVHVLHAHPGLGEVSIGVDEADPAITDLAFGELSPGVELPALDYGFWVDANSDGVYDLIVNAPLETFDLPPGSVVVVVAYLNDAGAPAFGALVLFEDFDANNFAGSLAILDFVPELAVSRPYPDVTVVDDALDLAVPDRSEASDTFRVNAPGCTVDHIAAEFGFIHDYASDLAFVLVAPDGTSAELGGPSSASATSFSYESASDFAGVSADGEWTLIVADDSSGDTGTVTTLAVNVWCATAD